MSDYITDLIDELRQFADTESIHACAHAADALEEAHLRIANLALANSEARKTIDRLNEMIPREANDAP